ncbi:MAG: polymer-forming cytoskeletal protein [Haloarculaceae archaeon]
MKRALTVLLALLVATAVLPGVAAAQTERFGNVVVEEGETVNGLQAFGGNVVIRGTVNGNVEAFSGNVNVAQSGTVTGDVQAFSGNVQLDGTVDGDVSAFGGNVVLGPAGTVGGTFEAAAGTVTLAGTVDGDARVAAETITLTSTASVGGDLEYDGRLTRADGASVAGSVTRNPDLEIGGGPGPVGSPTFAIPDGILLIYGLVVNFVVGAVLLLVFPRFSADVAERVRSSPLRTGGVGLLTVVVVPLVLLVIAITIIGIPLSLAGLLAFGLLAWLGAVYGRYALGSWLVSLVDVESRWLALAVGVVAVGLLGLVPILGGVVKALVFLLGFGALAVGLWSAYPRTSRGRRASPEATEGGAAESGASGTGSS